jgi:uncharacterized protein (TIGR01777 family)
MRITILGASGFIGRHLAAYLRARGDDVVAAKLRDPDAAAAACAGSEVVVNLAGAPVAGAKWTPAYKDEIRRSRVDVPRALIAELGRLPEERRPKAYVSASAVGYYGTSLTASFTEDSLPGNDFLADVCVEWEREALRARELGMRVAIVRTGIVLGADGGALKPLLPIFKLGGGGPIASGKQWYSWIHIDDQVGIYARAIDDAEGILNATAPTPATNADFTKALAAAVHRPAFLPTPVFALQLMFGEGAMMLTEGQRVLPARTESLGYVFKYREIDAAMRDAVVAR